MRMIPLKRVGRSQTEAGGILHETDIRRIWRGLLAVAQQQFPPDDDVSMLLRVIEGAPTIFDNSSSGQWPINEIVMLLSMRFPKHEWSVPRVDNAKRRLTNWIRRLMQKNRLDSTGLEALFARVARRKKIPKIHKLLPRSNGSAGIRNGARKTRDNFQPR